MSSQPKTSGIYLIQNVVTEQVYIGSTCSKLSRRFNQHKTALINNKHINPKLQNSWNKYGEQNFVFRVLEHDVPKDLLPEREKFYMNQFEVFNKEKGFNICLEPGQRYPQVYSPETADKIAKSLCPEGYIVTSPAEEEIKITNLTRFAKENALSEKCLFDCLIGKQSSHRGFKVRYGDKTKVVNWESSFDNKVKDYVLFDPEGSRHEVSNLRAWLEERSLLGLYTGLVQCATQEGQYSFHDWQCYYKENAPDKYTPAHLLKGYNQYFVVDPEGNYYNFTLKELKDFLENKEEKSENLVRLARKKLTKKSFKGYRCSLLENKEEVLKAIKLEELEKTLTSLEKKVDNILDSYFHIPENAENRDYCVYIGLKDWNPTIVKPRDLKTFCEKEGINYYRAMDCAAGRQKSTKNDKEEVIYIKRVSKE